MSTTNTASGVIDQLSELVAELAIMVGRHKVSGSAAPPNLALGVKGVAMAADTLHRVAQALAKDEYDDFPIIQEEIMDAAKDVKVGSQMLSDSVHTLETQHNAVAWDTLGHAVAQMAQKTSLLLHIVYGAEIKKILAQAANASAGVDALRADAQRLTPDSDPNAFLDRVKAEAAKLKGLADQLATAAAQEENPETKRQMKQLANALIEKSNEMLKAVNGVLQNPDDPKAKDALLAAIDRVAASTNELQPKQQPDNIRALIPRIKKAVDDVTAEKRRGWKPGKGKPAEDGPEPKRYNFVRPTQWDPEEEEPYKWPRLRHIEPGEKPSPPAHRPAWADARLRPSEGPASPSDPAVAPGANSPRGAAPVSPGRGPATGGGYQRPTKENDGETSPRRGWKPGQPRPAEPGPGPGKRYRIVPPNQLPFPPEDPPMAWPRLRRTDGPQARTWDEPDFPWRDVKPWMPQEETINAASRAHDDLEQVQRALADPSTTNGAPLAERLKSVGEQLDALDKLAPLLGKSAGDAVARDVAALRPVLKELVPAAVAHLKDRKQGSKAVADAVAALDAGLRRVLRQASSDDPTAPPASLKFRDPNLLPPPAGEPPFPWPKLRHWVCESVATAADEFEDTLRDWEARRAAGADEEPAKQHLREGLEVLHDVLAPRAGLETTEVLRKAAQTAAKELAKPKADIDAVRRALAPVRPESNLSAVDLAELRRRNAIKKAARIPALSPATTELEAVLSRVRAALDKSLGPARSPEERVAASALALRDTVTRTAAGLPKSAAHPSARQQAVSLVAPLDRELREAAPLLGSPAVRGIVAKRLQQLEGPLTKQFAPTVGASRPLTGAEVAQAQQAGKETVAVLDELLAALDVPSERLNHFRAVSAVNALVDEMMRLSSGDDYDEKSLLDASQRLMAMLGELSALLRLEGDVTGEAAELVRRLMAQMGATDVNKRPPPPTSSPRGQKSSGYDKIGAGADRIHEATLKLPTPVKGQQLLTDTSSVVLDSRKIAEALQRLGAAAKSGNGEALIAASRDVQTHSRHLAVDIKKMMAACTDRDTLDRLHNIHASLVNNPTQIKIMASVKASMDTKDYDKGGQLVSLVENLSASVLEVIPSVNKWILQQPVPGAK